MRTLTPKRGARSDQVTAAPRARVVHEDDALLVVDKPAGLLVHPAPGRVEETLVDQLGDLVGGGDDPRRPGVVHRLDRDTSGLLVVARSDAAHGKLAAAIQARSVERGYIALVDGRVPTRTGTIDAPLGRDHRALERVVVGGRAPREARTHFEVRRLLGSESLLDVRLETGRTHQIRVHLASIGHPVLGDRTYGGPRRYGLARQFLHAAFLGLQHPTSGERLEFTSELPDDLALALQRAAEAGG